MPTNSAPHKFSIGQTVVFLPTAFDHNTPRGGYVITGTLPGDDFDRSYRARSAADGLERVFREPQLRAESAWLSLKPGAVRHGTGGGS